mgnify:CR=1 FL=1
MTFDQLQDKIKAWGKSKGITNKKKQKGKRTIQRYAQTIKVQEETGELCGAILREDQPKIMDGIGDSIVTLILLAEIEGYTLEDCLLIAWNEIKSRDGKMVNGSFIKNN